MYTNPTPEQLNQINQYTPANMDPLEAGEIAVVSFLAADNLLNRGYGKWGIEELPTLAQMLPGLHLILDHNWGEVKDSQGLVFAANVNQTDDGPDWAIMQAGNENLNKLIVADEGYAWVQADAALPLSSPALQALRFGALGNVSLGGFKLKDLLCPLCGCSFDDEECPHYLPDPMWGMGDSDSPLVAPYYVRSGVYDLAELSIVCIPKAPAAGILTRQKAAQGIEQSTDMHQKMGMQNGGRRLTKKNT